MAKKKELDSLIIHKLKCTLLWPIMVVAVSVCVIAAVIVGSIKWAFNRDEDEFI